MSTTRTYPGPLTGCHAKNSSQEAGRKIPSSNSGLEVSLQHPLLTEPKIEPAVKGEIFIYLFLKYLLSWGESTCKRGTDMGGGGYRGPEAGCALTG